MELIKLINTMQREIKITVTAPCDCTEEQFKEWIESELNKNDNSITNENPLWLCDLNPDKIEFLD